MVVGCGCIVQAAFGCCILLLLVPKMMFGSEARSLTEELWSQDQGRDQGATPSVVSVARFSRSCPIWQCCNIDGHYIPHGQCIYLTMHVHGTALLQC